MPLVLRYMTHLFWIGLQISASGVCLSTLAGFLGRLWWRLDLFSHFRLQYFWLLTACTILFALHGQIQAAILCTLFAFINGLTFRKLIKLHRNPPQVPDPQAQKTCQLLLCNVLRDNLEYTRILGLIEKAEPELILLIESGKAWMEALEPLQGRYPYHLNQLWQEENYDIALFSRIPLESAVIHYFESATVPSILARIPWDDQTVTLIGTHPEPPKSYRQAMRRNQQMMEIARFVRQQKGPLIIAGDLNMTSWSPFFQDFLRSSGLQDSRLGRGIQPTWPAHLPPLMIPIDHILVTADIQVQRRTLGETVGSDHRPVILDFSILNSGVSH